MAHFTSLSVTQLLFGVSYSYSKEGLLQCAWPSRQAVLRSKERVSIKQLMDREKMCP